jgi:hypothetical protein
MVQAARQLIRERGYGATAFSDMTKCIVASIDRRAMAGDLDNVPQPGNVNPELLSRLRRYRPD